MVEFCLSAGIYLSVQLCNCAIIWPSAERSLPQSKPPLHREPPSSLPLPLCHLLVIELKLLCRWWLTRPPSLRRRCNHLLRTSTAQRHQQLLSTFPTLLPQEWLPNHPSLWNRRLLIKGGGYYSPGACDCTNESKKAKVIAQGVDGNGPVQHAALGGTSNTQKQR